MAATPDVSEVPAAIRAAKATLRTRIGDYRGALAEVEAALRREVAEIVSVRERGEEVWPVVRFADIAAGTVPPETVAAIRRRGCAVVQGTFPGDRAKAWDAELVSYLNENDFTGRYRYLDDAAFAGLAAGMPSIYPIYWSRPQMEARGDDNMVTVRGFLNSFWKHESQGRTWFDPTRDTGYPDRVRRSPEGKTTQGLSAHTDSGSLELWLLPSFQDVYRHVFSGNPADYDPWDGAYRTEPYGDQSTLSTSAFRTFQGWTALSRMLRTEGVLNVVPIPHALVYLLLRALQDDIAEDDLCGAAYGQSLPVVEEYHSVLLSALSPIPDVEPGDSVWWHCDMIHAVDPVEDQKGWGNVMYIPAAPHCSKNAEYARRCGQSFLAGESPADFAPENYEVGWKGRPTAEELNPTGRRQLGLQPW
jgi:hypothetical protein